MNDVSHLRQVIQVKKPRAWGFATVNMINNDGTIKIRDKALVVHFPSNIIEAAKAGSLWKVSGKERLNCYEIKDFTISEYVIDADEIEYLRPTGHVLSRWLNYNIKGIGAVLANRLVRTKNLKKLIDERNKDALLEVSGMTDKRVEKLFDQWPSDHLHKTIEWLEAQQLPLGLGDQLFTVFGSNSIEKIKSHPFLLLAMGVSFEKTMEVARSHGFSMSDDRVVAGIALHVAIQHTSRTGSTVIGSNALRNAFSHIAKISSHLDVGKIAVEHGFLVKVSSGYQIYGNALMEAAIASFIFASFSCNPPHLNREGISDHRVEKVLDEYEKTLNFPLTSEQREAVIGVISSPICCVSGEAGTGKTTIIKGILAIYAEVTGNIDFYQLALSGRAAQRMAQSTGRPAQTIAKFIYEHSGNKQTNLSDHALVIIDEASMVDLLSMYRLIGILPSTTRIVFVGDILQLQPVGAGLVFQTLINTNIPFFHLSHVKRQCQTSGIHRFATSIRESALEIPDKTQSTLAESSDCSLESNATIQRLIELWDEAGGVDKSMVLSPTKNGVLGVNNINVTIQTHMGTDRPRLHYLDPLHGWSIWTSQNGLKIYEGDPVIITGNNYNQHINIRNGELGKIIKVFEIPDDDGVLGLLEINGLVIGITSDILEKLELGYAITIHKSQSSEWETCFVALSDESINMIDQPLLYTAATRPSQKLILLSNPKMTEKMLKNGARCLHRNTFLSQRIAALTEVNQ